MDKEFFCEHYCPVPTKYYDPENPDDKWADCDTEESDCPFANVDFTKVVPQIGASSRDAEIEAARKEGRKQVVDWINANASAVSHNYYLLLPLGKSWQAKLKEWGL